MDVTFVETMRGEVVDAEGRESPVEFEVKALAPSVRGFLRTGRLDLSGLIRAPAVCAEAPARGELWLSPTLLRYRVTFQAPGGGAYLLSGEKRPRLLDPVRSFTKMQVTLGTAEGALVGRGTMRFDLRELAGFLRTWLPLGRHAQRALDARRRAVERRALEGAL